ncbi:MAG: 4Fe-4S binding protein [bacterium]|nr:4Fe-4S binding protein [bacterium]
MKRPKIRELGEAIRALVKGPYTVKFPYAPSPAAAKFRGIMAIDEVKCIGCSACVEVCPSKAREVQDDKDKRIRTLIYHQERCIYCGQCVDYCPTDALKHTQEYDIAQLTKDGYETKTEFELILCDECGEVIAPKTQLKWIAKKLGELAYDNPTLWLILSKELGTIEPRFIGEAPPSHLKVSPYRSGHLRLLCPRCRRSTYLHEIWGY